MRWKINCIKKKKKISPCLTSCLRPYLWEGERERRRLIHRPKPRHPGNGQVDLHKIQFFFLCLSSSYFTWVSVYSSIKWVFPGFYNEIMYEKPWCTHRHPAVIITITDFSDILLRVKANSDGQQGSSDKFPLVWWAKVFALGWGSAEGQETNYSHQSRECVCTLPGVLFWCRFHQVWIWGEAWDFAFLPKLQVKPMWLVQGPHFDWQGPVVLQVWSSKGPEISASPGTC